MLADKCVVERDDLLCLYEYFEEHYYDVVPEAEAEDLQPMMVRLREALKQ